MSAAVVMAQSRCVVIVASIVAIAGAKQASGTHQYGDKEQGHAWQRAGSLIVSLADLIP
jgi:hypothetical protein